MQAATPLRRAAPTTEDFVNLFTHDPRSMRTYALDHGVNEQALVRYTNGALSDDERETVIGMVARCKWAHEFVVALVKQRRRHKKRDAA